MNAANSSEANSSVTLTLITPCLNAADTIGDTLTSVLELGHQLQQFGLTYEHLIVDGGSADGTLQLIEAYQRQDPSSTLMRNVDGGPYPAMNAGLVCAGGIYTHILNADDLIWDVNAYVATLSHALAINAHFILASIGYFKRPCKQLVSLWSVDDLPVDRGLWQTQLRSGLHYPHPGFICRTDLYRSTPFDIAYPYSADYKLMQFLLLSADPSASICTSKDPLVAMAKGGITGQWQAIVKAQSDLKKINQELGIDAPLWRRYGKKFVSRYVSAWLRHFRRETHQG